MQMDSSHKVDIGFIFMGLGILIAVVSVVMGIRQTNKNYQRRCDVRFSLATTKQDSLNVLNTTECIPR